MILQILLLIFIILVIAILLLFVFYILFPSIENQNKITEDPIISDVEKEYIKPNHPVYEKNNVKALVLCSCHKNFSSERNIFNKEYSCVLVNENNGTGTDCKFACIGLGDCAKICPQNAIKIINKTAVITEQCSGCGKCINVCPLNIIRLVPENTTEYTLCGNKSGEKTSCTDELKSQKVEWKTKKDFKIWSFCYKIFKSIAKY